MDIHVIFKVECITFFYFLFFFFCFFCSFVSSLTIFSLSFSSFIFSFFLCSFLTLYIVIKIVKTEKYMRASFNATLLGNNIQNIVKELDYILVEKSTKIAWLLERLEFYKNHNVLIFSSWYYSTFSFFFC
jgi:hypothetical protein